MAVLWLLLLTGLPTVLLGVFVWVAVQNFLTADIPSTLKHPAKLWLMNCVGQYLIALVSFLLGPTIGWGFSLTLMLLLSLPSLLSLGFYETELGKSLTSHISPSPYLFFPFSFLGFSSSTLLSPLLPSFLFSSNFRFSLLSY